MFSIPDILPSDFDQSKCSMQVAKRQPQSDISYPTSDRNPLLPLNAEDIPESELKRESRWDTVMGQTDSETSRRAMSASSYLRDSKRNSGGPQPTSYTFRDYKVWCDNYEISPHHSAKLLLSVRRFGRAAKDFYFQNTGSGMAFEEVVGIMPEEYDSDAHQLVT